MRRFSDIYLASDILSNFAAIWPRGQANMFKHITCNGDSGATLYHNVTAKHDHIDVSREMWKVIDFKLMEAFGNTINLNNLNMSFTLVCEE